MKISVKVKANAKQEKVEKLNDREFAVWVREEAMEGKANKALVGILSEYFDVAKTRISILKGKKNKNKLVNIQ